MLDATTFTNMLVRCAMCACLAILDAGFHPSGLTAVPQEVIDALIRANAAVVGVQVAPPKARVRPRPGHGAAAPAW